MRKPKPVTSTTPTPPAPAAKPTLSPEMVYLLNIVNNLKVALTPSEIAKVLGLDLDNLFACEGEMIPLTALLKAVATSGLQSEIDVKQLKTILTGDAGLLKVGKLLHNVQVAYHDDKLVIVGGRNRTILIFCCLIIIGSYLNKDCVKGFNIPCQVLSYNSADDLYAAIVAANTSRRMASQEIASTLVSAKVKELTIANLSSAVLTEKEYKSLFSLFVRKTLAEKYGDSLLILDYQLGLKTARDSKFFLEYISKLLPKLSAIADKKTKLIQAEMLSAVLTNLTREVSELEALKADKFLSYLNQSDREIPNGLILPLCCYPIALFRLAGLEEIARSLTKTGISGLDGLAPLGLSLIQAMYGEKGLLKGHESIASTVPQEASNVSTIDISVFDF